MLQFNISNVKCHNEEHHKFHYWSTSSLNDDVTGRRGGLFLYGSVPSVDASLTCVISATPRQGVSSSWTGLITRPELTVMRPDGAAGRLDLLVNDLFLHVQLHYRASPGTWSSICRDPGSFQMSASRKHKLCCSVIVLLGLNAVIND